MAVKTLDPVALDQEFERFKRILEESGISEESLQSIQPADLARIRDLTLHREAALTAKDEAADNAVAELSALTDPGVTSDYTVALSAARDYLSGNLSPAEKTVIGMEDPLFKRKLGSRKVLYLGAGITSLITLIAGRQLSMEVDEFTGQLIPMDGRPGVIVKEGPLFPMEDTSCSAYPPINTEDLGHDGNLRRVATKNYKGPKGKTTSAELRETIMNRDYICDITGNGTGYRGDPNTCVDNLGREYDFKTWKVTKWLKLRGDRIKIDYPVKAHLAGEHSTMTDFIIDGDNSGVFGDSPVDMVLTKIIFKYDLGNDAVRWAWATPTEACFDGTRLKYSDEKEGSADLRKLYQDRAQQVLKKAEARWQGVRADLLKR